MSNLLNHLEQINLSAKSIGELEFPPSRPFTNALLHNQEITALIRDTEPHENGLFSIDPNVRAGLGQTAPSSHVNDTASRRKTLQHGMHMQSSAVARVLGSDLLRQIQSSNRDSGRGRRVNIDILLHGAEKLCAAYEVPGATERINTLRARYSQISASIQQYEGKIEKHQFSAGTMHENTADDDFAENHRYEAVAASSQTVASFSEEDVRAEEEIIRELEARKKALEARVAAMQKDLGGLRA